MDVDSSFSEETTPNGRITNAVRNPFGRGGAQTCVKGPAAARELTSQTTFKKRLPRAESVGGDAVKVFVRVKPTLAEDLKLGRNKEALTLVEKNGKKTITLPATAGKEHWFASEDFDGIFDDSTNQQVFDSVAAGLLPQFLAGINVSIMAYGQTGSGKTYTMFGSSEPGAQVHGLLHLALHSVDSQVCLGSPSARLHVSVVEVYNEELIVLLDAAGAERRPLTKGMADYNATKGLPVNDADGAIEVIMEALKLRTQDATVRNATSSRSHAIVRLQLVQPFAVSTLMMVDLAGSESISQASSNAQQRETININSSLHSLECVFNSMATRQQHLPFRNSKLTEALQEGIDPHKARVALVTTVSRFQSDVAVTKSTLVFAQRALNVRTYAQINPAPKRAMQSCPEELQRQLQDLQKAAAAADAAATAELRAQLANVQTAAEAQKAVAAAEAAATAELRAQLADVQAEAEAQKAVAAAEAAAADAQAVAVAVAELRAQLAGAQAAARQQAQEDKVRADAVALRLAAAEERAAGEGQALAGLQAEAAGLRQLLADKEAALGRQAAAASSALAAAVQEARAAAEAAAEQRLCPLRTEAERLRATCSLQEQQLARMQAAAEQQRVDAEAGAAAGAKLAAECAAARAERDEARRAAGEAGERAARLEAQIDAPRREAKSGLEERVRQLEAQLKRAEGDARGELELKDKLIHKLRLDVQQQQNELERLRQDTALAPTSDQQGAGSPYTAGGVHGRIEHDSPGDDGTPGAHGPGPARGPTSSYMMLGRTTTQGAAALRRNNKVGSKPGEMPLPPPYTASKPAVPLVDLLTPPRSGGKQAGACIDLSTPVGAATPREVEVPSSCEPASPHEDLLALVRGPARRPASYAAGARNQMNY
ncbi:Kinesin-like protein KIF11 [Tetrabaena socialis]|uniref:Kinesin-like protein n=1 Tax=Tetrabaena socialis TaxID=47790 RepID=A0A2J8AAF1_9CHLO|nr:Kinesin-like protein KIF11 [Tetrabaena socialis]|eukprot:PNH09504.1 Kinesin-like protein KIF11 [Tetrabaena socialis]